MKRTRRKLTDISTHISTLRIPSRQNFSLTAFKPALDLLSEGIIEFPTYFSGVSPAEAPRALSRRFSECVLHLCCSTLTLTSLTHISGDSSACLPSHPQLHTCKHREQTRRWCWAAEPWSVRGLCTKPTAPGEEGKPTGGEGETLGAGRG